MRIAILHNADHDALEEDPGRAAREDVVHVAAALGEALTREGHAADPVPFHGSPLDLLERLEQHAPDLIVNLCESVAGDSRGEMAVPALLELLGLPYTGSSALALGLALHKDKAKELLLARGVPTPEFRCIESLEEVARVDLPFPLIVKPAREDASMGIDFDSVVCDRTALGRAVRTVLRTYQQPALIERFVAGREIYVPVVGNAPREALPLSEIRFGPAFEGRPKVLSYRAKWALDSAECADSPSVPCSLPPDLEARVVQVALDAFEALGCRDYGRVDLRLAEDGSPYVIDINPNCDLHPHAGFAKSASAAGMTYGGLALRLVSVALERTHGHSSPRSTGSAAARRAAGPDRKLLAGRGPVRARARRPRIAAE